ncbi:hypothetical protein DICPUDRAFT_95921 [Dictyostelium purpureum]|uniref:RTA1-domain-containing protein n=1 Tax=Dictyostelium purpureum TaxID=5786 RepID=F1A2N1_DICPU|nr:uncharacterized protein DICPUDRAFT_95921 [Dictyostelium purpureum]EGC29551.1 hypothetical protein DICPUDRAFT_95921 [Dictyostelium purpureum]|eukprot:XP_003293921.1 hypothetical protein DICPUDRAFT_95921 [Dictyostelium purpureum]
MSSSSSSSSISSNTPKYPDLYGYEPSQGLSIAAIICFSLTTLILTFLSIKYKKWYFLVACVAGAVQTIGYGIRITSAENPHELGIYIATTLLILLPPTAFAAVFLFAQLGKIMKRTGIKHPIFRPNVVKFLFLGIDIFSIIVQSAGGALLAQTADNPKLDKPAKGVMLTGLCIALASFSLFFFLIIYLHIQVLKVQEDDKKWRIIFFGLYPSGILIILRSIYRVAEYAGGYHSAVMLNEPLFYGLDALPMFLLMCIWIPFHPAFVNLSKKGSKDKENKDNNNIESRGGVELE